MRTRKRIQWKKLAVASAALCLCLPTSAAMARHVSDGHSYTIVHTSPIRSSAAGQSRQNIKERIHGILHPSDRKADADSETWQSPSAVMHKLEITAKDEGGTLLFSDSPEYVAQDGILYRDTVEGDARVFYYHLNHTNTDKKLAVVLENVYDGVNTVRITRGASSGPSQDYMYVGKTLQMKYFSEVRNESIILSKGMSRVLCRTMNTETIQPEELAAGMYDFYALHPVKVSVVMLPVDADPIEAARSLPVLPRDEIALRGTFKGMNRVVKAGRTYFPERDGISYFRLGDDKNDRFRDGIDATDGSKVRNIGNYGVLYKINIPTYGKSGAKIYLSPLGGVYAGAVKIEYIRNKDAVVPVPQKKGFFGEGAFFDMTNPATDRKDDEVLHTGAELAELGTFGEGQSINFEFSPPGASNLPVHIILEPIKE